MLWGLAAAAVAEQPVAPPQSPPAKENAAAAARLKLAAGLSIEQVAGPPLVLRPICCDFDEQGRLYVADSSGSNEPVQAQLQKRPHRIVRLEDTDGDGRFDMSTVFADHMMFPEGAMWHDGSLYVGAPPHIWKLTDTDGDGVADRRELWFDGKTLGGCANDIHGPYLGPDGWFYWCKGEFARQTYARPKGPPLVTRAAHIFRRRPEGGFVEVVLSGGMNNPVEVAFSPGGERFLSSTFLENPEHGRRDGLIHAIYGGVYGKQFGVVDEHPRTGPLLPALTQMGAAAPCGLARLESSALGQGWADNLLACQFNMHKVSRHVLVPQGASFTTRDEDLVSSDDVDFHPTDVIEDADGSVLVIDTGGWYKVCCPTSQFPKPEVLGAIYRLRRVGARPVADPRGAKLAWQEMNVDRLAALLADDRPAVRRRAGGLLSLRGETAIATLADVLKTSASPTARLGAVWALTRIPQSAARAAVRPALADADEQVRQAAGHSAGVWRDAAAAPALAALLRGASLPNRRVAAEALGRIGAPQGVAELLRCAGDCRERAVEHSLTFALIEIGDAPETRRGLAAEQPGTRRTALLALDQMPGGGLTAAEMAPLLASKEAVLRDAVWWVADRHPDWAELVVRQVRGALFDPGITAEAASHLGARLSPLARKPAVEQLVAEGLRNPAVAPPARHALLAVIAASGAKQLSGPLSEALSDVLASSDPKLRGAAIAALHELSGLTLSDRLEARLTELSGHVEAGSLVRLQALSTARVSQAARKKRRSAALPLPDDVVRFLCENLSLEQPLRVRLLAVDVLLGTALTDAQQSRLCDALAKTGPAELQRLLPTFRTAKDAQSGLRLLAMLERHPALTSLDPAVVKDALAGFGPSLSAGTATLLARIEAANKDKAQRIAALSALVRHADPQRGQRVFFGAKASCSTCHAVGFLGGNVGPGLMGIGRIRTDRDLLASILYPSDTFVRTFETVVITTTQGKSYPGIIRDETESEVVLVLDAQKVIRIPQQEIEERKEGQVSIMPAGLDKVLTDQELADLVAFLKTAE